jgi:adenosylhomocysteine nucleosidase
LTEPVVGIVCALRSEARCLGLISATHEALSALADGSLVALSGVGWAAAAAAAERLVREGAAALASFGLAGGLDPALAAGTLLLPAQVTTPEGAAFSTDPEWRAQLAATSAAPVVGGRLVTARAAVTSATAKLALGRASGALAVDMESAAIAEVADRHGLPFVAVRAVVDDAAAGVPQAVLASTDAHGEVAVPRLLQALLRRPQDLPALLQLRGGYLRAARTLRGLARSGAPGRGAPLRRAGAGVYLA